jgi:ferredoxin
MTHIITSICLRDGGCAEVCPVECIVPGKPEEEWPLYYIDPDTCIDCGACVPECPWEAIFPEEDVSSAYTAKGTINVRGQDLPQRLNMPAGTPGFTDVYDGTDSHNEPVHLEGTRILKKGEVVDLTPSIQDNYKYFSEGPGYP